MLQPSKTYTFYIIQNVYRTRENVGGRFLNEDIFKVRKFCFLDWLYQVMLDIFLNHSKHAVRNDIGT